MRANRGRSRLTHLMVFIHVALVLDLHITFTNSKIQYQRRGEKRHQEERSRLSKPPSEVQSKHKINDLKTFGSLLKLNREGPVANLPTVKECPSGCYCELYDYPGQRIFIMENCTHDPIDALPKLFDSHRDISNMALINCRLSKLPAEILKLPLEYLFLLTNDFIEFPCQLSELTRLLRLDMDFNKLNSLPACATKWSTVARLDLRYNMITGLSQYLGRMGNLQVLDLSYNKLQSVPDSIGALFKMIKLILSHNRLGSIPPDLGNLTLLLELDLSHNELTSVPSEIGGLTSLQYLNLEYNRLTTLPKGITQLRYLVDLHLSNNPLGKVPELPTDHLAIFFCDNCSIQVFPNETLVAGLSAKLHLRQNSIKSFGCKEGDNVIGEVNLSNNLLDMLPCQTNFCAIQNFSVTNNNISSLPQGCLIFHAYPHRIHFGYNKIETLYLNSFCQATQNGQLSVVDFSHNRISKIDMSACSLDECFQNDAIIDLSINMLSKLSSWPFMLSEKIRIKLNVSNNNLSVFESSTGTVGRTSQFGSKFIMQGNQIKHFMDVFNGWRINVNTTKDLNALLKNAYFDLGKNPLVCDCVDYRVYRYIQTLGPEHYADLMCHEPPSLKRKNPHNIPLWHFVCDITVNCSDGCACSKVPHSHTVNVTCLNYNQTDIPEAVPDLPDQSYGYRLKICNQSLTEITSRPYLQTATEIVLSNNSITAIKINSSKLLQGVRILKLDNNHLQRLPESVTGIKNGNTKEIMLGGNPWICDCEAIEMRNWIMWNSLIVKDKDNILCESPPSMFGEKVMNIDVGRVCPNENKTIVYVVGAVISAVFIFVLYMSITERIKLTKWRLVGSDECEGEHKEFDIFMCACSAIEDSEYVENLLIPELERRDFKVLYHREHFHPGKPIHVNMGEALEKSKRTLVFFSNCFRQSEFSMFEFHSAYTLDIQNNTRRLITIKDSDLDMSQLELSEVHYFQKHTYLDRDDPNFWKLLEGALPKQRLGGQGRHWGLIN